MMFLLLNIVTCDLPDAEQLLHRHVTVVNVSQNHPLLEGQYITYTCSPGFVLTGTNALLCTGNGEWEPDPREAHCIGDLHIIVSYHNYGQSMALMTNFCVRLIYANYAS